MANEKNLIPNNKRSPSEVRENARKGGKKSGESRRKKRLLKDCMIDLLKLPVKDTDKWNALSQMGMDPKDIDNNMLLTVSLFGKAVNGDVAAFKEIRNLIGEDKESDGNGELENLMKEFNEL